MTTNWYLLVPRFGTNYPSDFFYPEWVVALDLTKVPERRRAGVIGVLARGDAPVGSSDLGWWDKVSPFSPWIDITAALIHYVKLQTVGPAERRLIDYRTKIASNPRSYSPETITMIYNVQAAVALAAGLNSLGDAASQRKAAEHLERAESGLDEIDADIAAGKAASDRQDAAAIRRALEDAGQVEAGASELFLGDVEFPLYDPGQPGRRPRRRWWLR